MNFFQYYSVIWIDAIASSCAQISSSFECYFLSFSKLQDSEKRNQDLQAEIERLKRETEELRLSKGKFSKLLTTD